MLLIPAIDLKAGQCVRLKQGDMQDATVFSDQPADMAQHWILQGAKRLHLVDLDGAFAGKSKNTQAIQAILATRPPDLRVQLGGGIRDLPTIEWWLNQGIDYVIIGTAAVKNPGFVRDAASIFPGSVIVGIDARDGMVAIDGWSKLTQHTALDLAKKFEDYGVNSIIYTDIARDGMLSGINIDATAELADALNIPVIASGGLSNMQDIQNLYAQANLAGGDIEGVICGRAIYTKDLDFQAAQLWVDAQKQTQMQTQSTF